MLGIPGLHILSLEVRSMAKLRLEIEVGPEELALRSAEGQAFALPLSFWRTLAEVLERSGYPELAEPISSALRALSEKEKLEEAKLQCMEAGLSPEEARRCREILLEEK